MFQRHLYFCFHICQVNSSEVVKHQIYTRHIKYITRMWSKGKNNQLLSVEVFYQIQYKEVDSNSGPEHRSLNLSTQVKAQNRQAIVRRDLAVGGLRSANSGSKDRQSQGQQTLVHQTMNQGIWPVVGSSPVWFGNEKEL